MKLIIENQYFACIDVIKKAIEYEHIVIERYENFQKSSFRNKCIILNSNGIQALSVPIIGGREQKSTTSAVRIDYSQNWQNDHWKGIIAAYRKSSFFNYYEKTIYDLLYSNHELLWDLNIEIFKWIFNTLKAEVSLGFTESYQKEYPNDIDLRGRILPKNFQYDWKNWRPQYFQVFSDRHGFQPNLSFLDLIFNEGPNARNLLLGGLPGATKC